jgi:hypothetical protein
MTHLDSPFILSVRLIHVDLCHRTHCNLSCLLMKGNSLKLGLLVDVCSLEDVVRAVEDDKRASRKVCLQEIALEIGYNIEMRGVAAYNDLNAFPLAMSDGLQLRLRPPGENAAH